MKSKILALLLCMSFIFGVVPAFADTTPEVLISSPADGSLIAPGVCIIEAQIQNMTADYAVIYLDGEYIAKLDNPSNISYTTENALAIGKHKLEIMAVSADAAIKSTSEFYCGLSEINTIKAMDNMDNAPTVSGFVNNLNNASSFIEFKKVEGPGGSGDNALGVSFKSDRSETGYINPYMTFAAGNWSGLVSIEFDVRFPRIVSFLEFETKSTHQSVWGWFFNETKLMYCDGSKGSIKVNGSYSSSLGFPVDEWFKLKMEIDFASLKGSMWIGTYDNGGNISYTQVFDNQTQMASLDGITQLKLQPYLSAGNKDEFIGFDNLQITETFYTKGFDNIGYLNNGNYEYTGDDSIKAGATKIKLGATNYADADVKSLLKATSDNVDIALKSAEIKDEELLVEFDREIDAATEYKLSLSGDAKLSGGSAASFPTEYRFRSLGELLTVKNADFTVNSDAVYTSYQLSPGDDVDVTFTYTNEGSEDIDLLAVAVIYSDDRPIMPTVAKKLTFEGGATDKLTDGMTIAIPSADAKYTMEVYLVKSFADSAPMSKVWSVK